LFIKAEDPLEADE
jgi:hypothetical protein